MTEIHFFLSLSPLYPYVSRFANGYCSRVGGKVRGWVHFCTCLMGNALLIGSRSFIDSNFGLYTDHSILGRYVADEVRY